MCEPQKILAEALPDTSVFDKILNSVDFGQVLPNDNVYSTLQCAGAPPSPKATGKSPSSQEDSASDTDVKTPVNDLSRPSTAVKTVYVDFTPCWDQKEHPHSARILTLVMAPATLSPVTRAGLEQRCTTAPLGDTTPFVLEVQLSVIRPETTKHGTRPKVASQAGERWEVFHTHAVIWENGLFHNQHTQKSEADGGRTAPLHYGRAVPRPQSDVPGLTQLRHHGLQSITLETLVPKGYPDRTSWLVWAERPIRQDKAKRPADCCRWRIVHDGWYRFAMVFAADSPLLERIEQKSWVQSAWISHREAKEMTPLHRHPVTWNIYDGVMPRAIQPTVDDATENPKKRAHDATAPHIKPKRMTKRSKTESAIKAPSVVVAPTHTSTLPVSIQILLDKRVVQWSKTPVAHKVMKLERSCMDGKQTVFSSSVTSMVRDVLKMRCRVLDMMRLVDACDVPIRFKRQREQFETLWVNLSEAMGQIILVMDDKSARDQDAALKSIVPIATACLELSQKHCTDFCTVLSDPISQTMLDRAARKLMGVHEKEDKSIVFDPPWPHAPYILDDLLRRGYKRSVLHGLHQVDRMECTVCHAVLTELKPWTDPDLVHDSTCIHYLK